MLSRDREEFNRHTQLDRSFSLEELTRQAVQQLERKIILKVLEANNWTRKRSARALNISYRALIYKIRQAGMPSKTRARRAQSPVQSPLPTD